MWFNVSLIILIYDKISKKFYNAMLLEKDVLTRIRKVSILSLFYGNAMIEIVKLRKFLPLFRSYYTVSVTIT